MAQDDIFPFSSSWLRIVALDWLLSVNCFGDQNYSRLEANNSDRDPRSRCFETNGSGAGSLLTSQRPPRQPFNMSFRFGHFAFVLIAAAACALAVGCSSTTTTSETTAPAVIPPAPVTTSSTTSTTNTITTTQPDGTVVKETTTTTMRNGRVVEKEVRSTYAYPSP